MNILTGIVVVASVVALLGILDLLRIRQKERYERKRKEFEESLRR